MSWAGLGRWSTRGCAARPRPAAGELRWRQEVYHFRKRQRRVTVRFTVKLVVGYVAFSLITLALGAALLFTFKSYQSTSHLIFLLDQQRSDEQSLQIALLLELQAVEDHL